jgi:hypothetical protein
VVIVVDHEKHRIHVDGNGFKASYTQELFVHHFLSDTTSTSDASVGPGKVNVLP